MAYLDIDSDLLQRIRVEIASQGDGGLDFGNLADVGRGRLRVHLERLFYGGEVAASCRIDAGELDLQVRRLTPYGVLAMHAEFARNATLRRTA